MIQHPQHKIRNDFFNDFSYLVINKLVLNINFHQLKNT